MGRAGLSWVALGAALVALIGSPAPASALELELVNRSEVPDDEVYVTVAGRDFDVPGQSNDTPARLDSIPGSALRIERLVGGRVYVAYGAGVRTSVPFDSPTRFHWAELTVTPGPYDVANLTAVDQFAIGMRLQTLDSSGRVLETLSDSNADRVFAAMAAIPGGRRATVEGADGSVLRVLSPTHTEAYPALAGYVRSMRGRRVSLSTAFYGDPFTTSSYAGTFGRDGSITLRGATNPAGQAPSVIEVDGARLISDIYTGGNTPNNAQGAIYRDLLAGFSAGFWGGRYGNDAIGFCTDPVANGQGAWCPSGFNQPAFGAARRGLARFATCEQYAAVIDRHSDAYGNPYSDASKRVLVSLDQPPSGEVAGLRLTILPDLGKARPQARGNSNCGAGSLGSRRLPAAKAGYRDGVALVGTVRCPPTCGAVAAKATLPRARSGAGSARSRLLGRGHLRMRREGSDNLLLRLNRAGRKRLRERQRIRVRIWVQLRSSEGLLDTRRRRMTLTDSR